MAKIDKREMPPKGQIVRVHNLSGRDGYRRGGRAHKDGVNDYAHDTFTAEQLDQLDADPKISLAVVDAPKAEKSKE